MNLNGNQLMLLCLISIHFCATMLVSFHFFLLSPVKGQQKKRNDCKTPNLILKPHIFVFLLFSQTGHAVYLYRITSSTIHAMVAYFNPNVHFSHYIISIISILQKGGKKIRLIKSSLQRKKGQQILDL